MIRRRVMTAAGLALACAIAAGGWFITDNLMKVKSDKLLLSLDGIITSSIPFSALSSGDSYERPVLSDVEITEILDNWSWKTDGAVTAHEPTPEQLSMDDAIEQAAEWVSTIGIMGIFPGEALNFDGASAYLSQKLPIGGGAFLPPEYSRWTIGFSNDYLNIEMNMNAVTGQVWTTNIVMNQAGTTVDVNDVTHALEVFCAGLGVNFDGMTLMQSHWLPDVIWAHRYFAEGSAYAAAAAHGAVTAEGVFSLDALTLYLVTEN